MRRWRLVVPVCAGVGVVVLLAPLLVAPYRASTLLLLPGSGANLEAELTPLRSRALVATVVKELPAAEQPSRLAAALATVRHVLHDLRSRPRWPQDDAIRSVGHEVEELRTRLEVEPLRGSNLIEVGLPGSDPAWASAFLDRLAAAYVERQRAAAAALLTGKEAAERDGLLGAKLAESESVLRELREKMGTYGGEAAEIRQRLVEFDTELARVQVSRAEQEERVAYLQRVPPSAEKHVSPQLAELETKRAELLARYLPESKRIQEIDEEIRHLRSSAAVDTPVAPPRADAGSELVAARAVLAALSGREKALAQGREEYRRRLVMLEAQGGELARLEQRVKVDEEAYVSSARTAEQSRLAPAPDPATLPGPTVIAPASVSRELPTAATLALLVGLIAGLAPALGRAAGRGRDDAPPARSAAPESSAPRRSMSRDVRPAVRPVARRTVSRALPVALAIVFLAVRPGSTPLADPVTPGLADDVPREHAAAPRVEPPSMPMQPGAAVDEGEPSGAEHAATGVAANPGPSAGPLEKRAPARQTVIISAGESILTLVRKLSHRTLTVREEAEVITQVKRLNPHIFNPDLIRPGDRVILPGCIGCTMGPGREAGA
jgi:uncharacterized protein involved in exopolysaccharide biosynthesis